MDVLSDRTLFFRDLAEYMSEQGKPVGKPPIMGYREIDFFQFFRLVMSNGGFDEVVKRVGTWTKIWKSLDNFSADVTDASFRLRKNYERYLLEYEQKRFPIHAQNCHGTLSHLQATFKALSPSSPRLKTRTPPIRRNKIEGGKASPMASPKVIRETGMEQFSHSIVYTAVPFVVGDVIVESFGKIISRTPYITNKSIYPVGYTSTKTFRSMKDPSRMIKYTNKIIDDGTKPVFVVIAEDDLENPVTDKSPSGVWKRVLRKVFGENAELELLSYGDQFGLNHPIIKRALLDLPNGKDAQLLLTPKNKRKMKVVTENAKAAKMEQSSSSNDESDSSPRAFGTDVDDDLESAVNTLSSFKLRRNDSLEV